MKDIEKSGIKSEDSEHYHKLNKIDESHSDNHNFRKFGFAKGTFIFIAEDFDELLEEFKDYMP